MAYYYRYDILDKFLLSVLLILSRYLYLIFQEFYALYLTLSLF